MAILCNNIETQNPDVHMHEAAIAAVYYRMSVDRSLKNLRHVRIVAACRHPTVAQRPVTVAVTSGL